MLRDKEDDANQDQVCNAMRGEHLYNHDILAMITRTLYPQSAISDAKWYSDIKNSIGIDFEEIYKKPYGRFDGLNFLIVWLKSLCLNDHEKSKLLNYLLNSGFYEGTDSEQREIPQNICIDNNIITSKGIDIIISSREILKKYLNIDSFEELNAVNAINHDTVCVGLE